MVNELTLDEMILSAFAAVAQTNGALFLGAIYNGDEECRVMLLQSQIDQMEMQNSSVSLFSLLNDMTNLSEQIAEKKVSNIKQFYDDGRLIISADNTKVMEYDRMSARDVKFRISIKESGATASVAQQANDVGIQLLQMGAIDALTFLQGSTLPFKDLYINAIQDRQAQMALEQQAQQMQQGMSPEQQQQANDNTQQAQQMLQAV